METDNTVIEVQLTDGTVSEYRPNEYTGYSCNGNFFLITNGDQWVGLYNLAYVVSIEVYPVPVATAQEKEAQ